MFNAAMAIEELLLVMRTLRDPQRGCPWDLQQTFSSIAPFTIEEAYEVVDAIDRGDMIDLRDELGDLLLQVVFHSRMAEEAGAFNFIEVVQAITQKMLRRHPHVFAVNATPSMEVQEVTWEEHKRREREDRGNNDLSALAGVARGLPEWQRAIKLQKKAATVGFDWTSPKPVIEKLREEILEVCAEFDALKLAPDDAEVCSRLEAEIGDLLFVCANVARHAKVDVGSALRRANSKFERRFRQMENFATRNGTKLSMLSLQEQEAYWALVKLGEER